jgi:micrococcal nuclease
VLQAILLAAALAASPTQAKVVAVHDGDTITVRIEGRSEKVRLVGIDSPELDDERSDYRQEGYAARDFARSKLAGETVTLEAEPHQGDRDRYGRLLRYVILGDGSDFNETMVRTGHAHVCDRFSFTKKAAYKSVEAEAKREKRGVWSLPPGPWREVPGSRP